MSDQSPHERLAELERETARLRRVIAYRSCAEGHTWVCEGGANAGCGDDCACSVPVYRCSVCEVYDYGDNQEAFDILASCKEQR
jgi:hypothetical protein